MTQNQVHRAVAKATGESVGTIRQMGFSVADPDHVRFDPEPPDLRDIEERIIDWDLYERRRNVPIVPHAPGGPCSSDPSLRNCCMDFAVPSRL